MRPTLVIMAKAPRAGLVKSRLAAEVGVVEATRFSRVALARIVRRLGGDPRWNTRLAVSPDMDAGATLWPAGIPRIPQGRGDLGARMQRLMDALPPGPAAIVGSDVPAIRPGHIAATFAAITRHDAVFGPAVDGGYWLVALRRRPRVPRIFSGVRWSGPDALADTVANCGGLSVGFVDTLADVDDADGWRRWRRAEG